MTPEQIDHVRTVTYRGNEEADFYCARAMAYLIDKEKSKRLAQATCRRCFYLHAGQMCGQAFTKWRCQICDKERMHPNTATPYVCEDCAMLHALCVRCGGDVHGRAGRRYKT